MQSINIVENIEFCQLILLLQPKVEDKDIPHRTKMTSLVMDEFQRLFNMLKIELQVCVSPCNISNIQLTHLIGVNGRHLLYWRRVG